MHKRNFVQLSKFRAMCPQDTYLYIYPYVPPILEMQLSFTFLFFERISIMAKKRTYGITIPKRVYQEILNYLFNTDLTETQELKEKDYLKRELMNYVQIQLFWQRQKNYISDIEILKEIHREIREYNDLWTR